MLQALRGSRLFRDRSEVELEGLSGLVSERRLEAGEQLYHDGQEGKAFYMLLKGELRRQTGAQSRWVEGPDEQSVAPGQLIGVSVLRGGTHRATVWAVVPSILWVFGPELIEHPGMPEWLRRGLEEIIIKEQFSDQVLSWLRHARMFRGLPPRELERVMMSMVLEQHPAGARLMVQGERSAGMGLIVRGEARMVLNLAPGRRVEIAALTEGDLYGESGLLNEVSREVTVEAVTPLMSFVLRPEHVKGLVKEAPLLQQLLVDRLESLLGDGSSARRRQGVGVLVSGHMRGVGRSSLAIQLATELAANGNRVALVDAVAPWQAPSLARMLKLKGLSPLEANGDIVHPEIWLKPMGERQRLSLFELEMPRSANFGAVKSLLAELKSRFEFVVVDGPALSLAGVSSLTGSEGRPGLAEETEWVIQVTQRPREESPVFEGLSREVVRVVPERGSISLPYIGRDLHRMPWEPDVARRFHETGVPWVEHQPSARSSKVVRRLVRVLTQRQVGIALSGGGNWGFSHIGVLQVLEEHGIPIDMISGTSCGSFIGGLAATGLTGSEIEELLIRDIYPGFLKFVSPSLFMRDGGLIKADSFERFLRDVFKGRELTELSLPFWPNAMDAASGEEVVFRQGPVYQGVTAAAALPGLFAPYAYNGRVMLDGGLINNLPLGILYEMGCNVSIGVNCIPHLHPASLPEPPAALSQLLPARARGGYRSTNMVLGPLMMPVTAMSTLNMVMRGIQMLCHKVGEEAGRQADVYLQPEVGGAQWFEFHKVREMIEAGRRCAERHLPRLREACLGGV